MFDARVVDHGSFGTELNHVGCVLGIREGYLGYSRPELNQHIDKTSEFETDASTIPPRERVVVVVRRGYEDCWRMDRQRSNPNQTFFMLGRRQFKA